MSAHWPVNHDNADFEIRVNFGDRTNQRAREKEAKMIIIGCDYHPGFQQIAFVDSETGELQERRPEPKTTGAVPQPTDNTHGGSHHLVEVRKKKLGSSDTGSQKTFRSRSFSTPTGDFTTSQCCSRSSLQQTASLDRQNVERHFQLSNGCADFWMLSDLFLQRVQNLVSACNMRCGLGGTLLGITFGLLFFHGHFAPPVVRQF
jgi:hypothetical protein